MSPEQKIDAFISGDDARRRQMSKVLASDLDPAEIQSLAAKCQPDSGGQRSLAAKPTFHAAP
jgi:hypothetical protein